MLKLMRVCLVLASLVFLTLAAPVQAQIRDSASPTGDEVKERVTGNIEHGFERAIKALRKVHARTGNPEIAERIQKLEERKEQVQERVAFALRRMDERPMALRFLIGPNYRNVGEVRSEIVHLRNEIRQQERLRERVSTTDQADIDASISELKAQEDQIKAELSQRTSGFSLFGWLARFLTDTGEEKL